MISSSCFGGSKASFGASGSSLDRSEGNDGMSVMAIIPSEDCKLLDDEPKACSMRSWTDVELFGAATRSW